MNDIQNKSRRKFSPVEVTLQKQVDVQVSVGYVAEHQLVRQNKAPDESRYRFDGFSNFSQAFNEHGSDVLQKVWRDWFGHVNTHQSSRGVRSSGGNNAYLTAITDGAARFLLGHQDYFDLGIDLDHLPQGFKMTSYLTPEGIIERHLDYSPFAPESDSKHEDGIEWQPRTSPLAITIEETDEKSDVLDLNGTYADEDAMEREVDNFLPEQKTWWDALNALNPNNPVGAVDVKFLDAFREFSAQIKEKGLAFYDLDALAGVSHFPGIESTPNLQVLLGRMITILNNADVKDVKTQWECITQLDLTPQGAILSIQDRADQASRCRAILPEMHADYQHYQTNSGMGNQGIGYFREMRCTGDELELEGLVDNKVHKDLRSVKEQGFRARRKALSDRERGIIQSVGSQQAHTEEKLLNLDEKSQENLKAFRLVTIEAHYFRAIAHEPKSLPLAFYREAFRRVKEKFLDGNPELLLTTKRSHVDKILELIWNGTSRKNYKFAIKDEACQWEDMEKIIALCTPEMLDEIEIKSEILDMPLFIFLKRLEAQQRGDQDTVNAIDEIARYAKSLAESKSDSMNDGEREKFSSNLSVWDNFGPGIENFSEVAQRLKERKAIFTLPLMNTVTEAVNMDEKRDDAADGEKISSEDLLTDYLSISRTLLERSQYETSSLFQTFLEAVDTLACLKKDKKISSDVFDRIVFRIFLNFMRDELSGIETGALIPSLTFRVDARSDNRASVSLQKAISSWASIIGFFEQNREKTEAECQQLDEQFEEMSRTLSEGLKVLEGKLKSADQDGAKRLIEEKNVLVENFKAEYLGLLQELLSKVPEEDLMDLLAKEGLSQDSFDNEVLKKQKWVPNYIEILIQDNFKEPEIKDEIKSLFVGLRMNGSTPSMRKRQEDFLFEMMRIQGFLHPVMLKSLLKTLNKVTPHLFEGQIGSSRSVKLTKLLSPIQKGDHAMALTLLFEKSLAMAENDQPKLDVQDDLFQKALFFSTIAIPAMDNALKNSPALQESQAEIRSVLSQALLVTVDFNDKRYANQIEDFLERFAAFSSECPLSKELFFKFIETDLLSYCGEIAAEQRDGTSRILQTVSLLNDCFEGVEKPEVVRTLMFHATDPAGDAAFKKDLRGILERVRPLELKSRTAIFQMIAALLNKRDFKATLNEPNGEFNQLLGLFEGPLAQSEEKGAAYQALPKDFLIGFVLSKFARPPYPSLSDLLQWHNSAVDTDGSGYEQILKGFCEGFDKNPAPRDEKSNGFKVKEAQSSIGKFDFQFEILDENDADEKEALDRLSNLEQGITAAPEEIIRAFEIWTTGVKEKNSDQLRETLKNSFKSNQRTDDEIIHLIAIVAELLYRAQTKKNPQQGETYELNTTQYLALYYAMKMGGKGTPVTLEMFTGEGKTRIDTILIAIQALLGDTVDFTTSDMSLAMRDFQKFQPFFQILGVPISLIDPNSPVEVYKMDGVNFTTVANLELFRNKARVDGRLDQALNPDPTKRAVLVAEGDDAQFDSPGVLFNYSESLNPAMHKMEWLYEALIAFFDDPVLGESRKAAFLKGEQQAVDSFNQFVKTQYSPVHAKHLEKFSEEQLKTWQGSALTALQSEFLVDFDIRANQQIETPEGPITSSEALVKQSSRITLQSKYSKGVHECLHARLTRLQRDLKSPKKRERMNPELCQALERCGEHPFHFEVEKRIADSSDVDAFFADYEKGTRTQTTGSPGSDHEIEAARLVDSMRYVHVPRHHALKRVDSPTYLAANFDAKIAEYVRQILEARKQQPKESVLIFEEDDQASLKVSVAIQQKLEKLGQWNENDFQRIDAMSEIDGTFNQHIERVDRQGMVTVSTRMVARGMDKNVDRVLIGYLPSVRVETQEKGRTGRFGRKGRTQMILDRVAVQEEWGDLQGRYGFFTSAETFIARRQAQLDRAQQCYGLIQRNIRQFDAHFKELFWQPLPADLDETLKAKITKLRGELWKEYLLEKQKAQEATWRLIDQHMLPLEAGKPQDKGFAITAINGHLHEYAEKMQFTRDRLTTDWVAKVYVYMTHQQSEDGHSNLRKVLENLAYASFPPCWLGGKTQKVLGQFDVEKIIVEPKVYRAWESALSGRAKVYGGLFAETWATVSFRRRFFDNTRAWWEGRGILFADTRAVLKGERAVFANTRASIHHLYQSFSGKKPDDQEQQRSARHRVM